MKRNFSNTQQREGGFSLIEVTIAMAIAAVALVTLLGMIPQGMDTMREAGDEAIEGRIHQQLLNELQMTPFEDNILNGYHGMEFYYDAQGEELSDSKQQGSVPEDKKKGSLAHIYSARVTLPDQASAPASVGGANFQGYSFEGIVGSDPNPFVRPVIVEVAAVAGLGDNFDWDSPDNRHMISTYQSIVVKMGRDLR